MDTLVISDVHLGAAAFEQKDKLLSALRRYVFSGIKKIIINGDLVDVWRDSPEDIYNGYHDIFVFLNELHHEGIEVFWVIGNHDGNFEKFHMPHVQIVRKLEEVRNNKRVLFVHGDEFDATIVKFGWLTKITVFFQELFDRIFGTNIVLFFKKALSQMTGDPYKKAVIEQRDMSLTKYKDYDIVVCGHTQYPHIYKDNTIGTVYINTGTWLDKSTVTIFDEDKYEQKEI